MTESQKSVEFSKNILGKLNNEILKKQNITAHKNFCIYTTGSYGREEAGKESDIDLFFVDSGDHPIRKIEKILIDADLIGITRKLGFPEFSGDGEYLEVHKIENITKELGGRNDDYLNYFTARMLLILESKPLYNDKVYSDLIDSILDQYYIDFNENETFHPMFLVNDIIRFWRTLCLNYEYGRSRKVDSEEKKIKSGIKNYKLKFSRKLTCYSLLLNILFSKNDNLTKDDIKIYINLTPLQRLNKIRSENISNQNIVLKIDNLLNLYNHFLKITHTKKDELNDHFSLKNNRDIEFQKAREFSKEIFDLMMMKKDDEKLKYFLV